MIEKDNERSLTLALILPSINSNVLRSSSFWALVLFNSVLHFLTEVKFRFFNANIDFLPCQRHQWSEKIVAFKTEFKKSDQFFIYPHYALPGFENFEWTRSSCFIKFYTTNLLQPV